ncbi:MAG: DUF4421 family protein [Bacteroidia bacterium]|nr:DUF4421 family protein [Bacteroidia bacterium]
MKILRFLFFILLLPSLSQGQFFKKIFAKSDDTLYIEKFKNKITIRPFVSQQFMSLNLIDRESTSQSVVYNPNVNMYAGFDFNYKIFGFSLATKIPPLPKTQEKLGQTKFFNFKLNITSTYFGAETFFQRYKGFYLFNINDFAGLLHDSIPQLSDLSVCNFGISAYFQKSKYLSMAAAFNQTKRQIKSAGSFLFMTSYLFTGIFNENKFVADSIYPNIAKYKSGIYNTLAIAPGYGYTFVFKESFYITMIGFAGVGLQPQYNKYFDDNEFKLKFSYKLNFKTAIGYNGKSFFGGLSAGADINTIKLNDINIRVIPMFWKLGGGFRF